MKKHRKLIIVGDSAFAQVAYEFFTHDSEYEVVAFSVERNYEEGKALRPAGRIFRRFGETLPASKTLRLRRNRFHADQQVENKALSRGESEGLCSSFLHQFKRPRTC